MDGEEVPATLEGRASPLVVPLLPTRPALGLLRDGERVVLDDPAGAGVVSEDPARAALVGGGSVHAHTDTWFPDLTGRNQIQDREVESCLSCLGFVVSLLLEVGLLLLTQNLFEGEKVAQKDAVKRRGGFDAVDLTRYSGGDPIV